MSATVEELRMEARRLAVDYLGPESLDPNTLAFVEWHERWDASSERVARMAHWDVELLTEAATGCPEPADDDFSESTLRELRAYDVLSGARQAAEWRVNPLSPVVEAETTARHTLTMVVLIQAGLRDEKVVRRQMRKAGKKGPEFARLVVDALPAAIPSLGWIGRLVGQDLDFDDAAPHLIFDATVLLNDALA